jgi:hypothetical protein
MSALEEHLDKAAAKRQDELIEHVNNHFKALHLKLESEKQELQQKVDYLEQKLMDSDQKLEMKQKDLKLEIGAVKRNGTDQVRKVHERLDHADSNINSVKRDNTRLEIALNDQAECQAKTAGMLEKVSSGAPVTCCSLLLCWLSC